MDYRKAVSSYLDVDPSDISDWFECGQKLVVMLKGAAVKDLKKRQIEIKLSNLTNE